MPTHIFFLTIRPGGKITVSHLAANTFEALPPWRAGSTRLALMLEGEILTGVSFANDEYGHTTIKMGDSPEYLDTPFIIGARLRGNVGTNHPGIHALLRYMNDVLPVPAVPE